MRVLEDKNKSKKDAETKEKPVVDIVDERGFVDGVKVARKCSKANVLGKAVEYIRYVDFPWIFRLYLTWVYTEC